MKGNVYTICFAAILGTVCATLLTVVSVFTKDAWESNKLAEKNRNIFASVSLEYDEDANAEVLMDIFSKNFEEKSSTDKLVEIFEEAISGKGTADELSLSFAEKLKGKKFADEIVSIFKKTYSADANKKELIESFEKNLASLEDKYPTLTLYRYYSGEETLAVALDFDGPGLWGPVKGILAFEKDLITIKGITFYEHEETPGIGGDIALPYFRDRFVGKKIVDVDGKAGIVIKAGLTKPGQNEIDGITGATMTIDKVSDMLNEKINLLISDK